MNTFTGNQKIFSVVLKGISKKCLFFIILLLLMTSCSGQDNGTDAPSYENKKDTLLEIRVTSNKSLIHAGSLSQLKATGIYTDKKEKDITDSVSWQCDNEEIAEFLHVENGYGKLLTKKLGPVTITAQKSSREGSFDTIVIEKKLVSIEVEPQEFLLNMDMKRSLKAWGIYTDNSKENISESVIWSSENVDIIEIDNSGMITGKVVGDAVILVNDPVNNISGNTEVKVVDLELREIEIIQKDLSIPFGTTKQYTVTGFFRDEANDATREIDITDNVIWEVIESEGGINSDIIDESGLATGNRSGSYTITAEYDGIKSPAVELTVTSAVLKSITVTLEQSSIAKGESTKAKAVGNYTGNINYDITDQVVWSSSVNNIVSIDGSNITGDNIGEVMIIAKDIDSDISGDSKLAVKEATLVSLEILPDNVTASKGEPVNLTAMGTYTDGSRVDETENVIFRSANQSIATINNIPGSKGIAQTTGVGTVVISCVSEENISAETQITVEEARLISFSVTPVNYKLASGYTILFNAQAVFTDGIRDVNSEVTWSSGNPEIATIENNGLATGVNTGETNITVTYPGEPDVTIQLEVIEATLESIVISPSETSVPLGKSIQYKATGSFSSGEDQDITNSVEWSATDSTVISISNITGKKGICESLKEGESNISASKDGIVAINSTLTVLPPVMVSLEVTSDKEVIKKGEGAFFTATGTNSNGETVDLTESAEIEWDISDISIADISNIEGEKGWATGKDNGYVTVKATYSSGSVNLTGVSELKVIKLVSIKIDSGNISIDKNQSVQLKIIGKYTDNTEEELPPSSFTWSSSDNYSAEIDESGIVKGVTVGETATVSAEYSSEIYDRIDIRIIGSLINETFDENMPYDWESDGDWKWNSLWKSGFVNKTNGAKLITTEFNLTNANSAIIKYKLRRVYSSENINVSIGRKINNDGDYEWQLLGKKDTYLLGFYLVEFDIPDEFIGERCKVKFEHIEKSTFGGNYIDDIDISMD
ncbi:MAG: hypothetical protein GY760_29455 [Deltaproteobacteria bacterium]|nr:hypothetical protein [Deltaproteobacteria bacterium]